MHVINSESESFLRRYLNNASPTGYEWSGQKLWLEYIKPYIDEWQLDNYGTAYGIINPGQPYKVVIEGHADEISWFVNYVTDDGFIHVIRNGGSDFQIAPSMRVWIHLRQGGKIEGVFGWPAIHTRTDKDASLTPALDNITIDVGAKDRDEVLKMGIHVGCVITFQDELTILNERYYTGRALDNRMGGFCIAEVARVLKENNIKLPYTLYIVNSVQEEVGLRGAEMVTQSIRPNVAIVTDVTHDTHTPMISSKKHGDVRCGNGPSVTYAPAVHQKLLDIIIGTAESLQIPFQREAASRVTGTDTDAFAYSNGGVPSALISLPLRYMHTTVEMAHKDDVNNLIWLIYETLQKIENGQDFRYFTHI
ncbi:MAG TPA: M42 family metallopeptidase [Saprospiraceae bacterium]|nr:M42 family metallopeptidase [Saprospiraceae bacterium]HPI06943.1 M42 family metallopeptidase [Saprospiraceae bacterium]